MYCIRCDFYISGDSGTVEYHIEDEVAEKLLSNAPKEWIAKQFVLSEVQIEVSNVEVIKNGIAS